MKDSYCVNFLQWALPQIHMRWQGFRKVRKQVCKRIDRRTKELFLSDVREYQNYLQHNRSEWDVLVNLCRITISRFFRDKGVFESIGNIVLPELAQMAISNGDRVIRCWSAGCASGEEAYTIALIWEFLLKDKYPYIDIQITATDIDPAVLGRAELGSYPLSSIRELPEEWISRAFRNEGDQYFLRSQIKGKVAFCKQDIRKNMTFDTPFHLVLCRNLVFTYFDESLQGDILARIYDNLFLGGGLIIGIHESLPEKGRGFSPWISNQGIYRKVF